MCVYVCAALTLIIPHHARQHATQLLNAALRPPEEGKNVRGICLSLTNTNTNTSTNTNTNTNEYTCIHPTFIECVMGFSSVWLLTSASPHLSFPPFLLLCFSFYDFAPSPFCVTIPLPVLQYIYIYTYILACVCVGVVYIGLVERKKVSLGSGKKFCVSAQSHPIKRLAAKGASVPDLLPVPCSPPPPYLPPSLSHNIPSTVASDGCGLMSLPRHRQTHTQPHTHTHSGAMRARSTHIHRTELSSIFHLLRSFPLPLPLPLPCVLVSIFVEV